METQLESGSQIERRWLDGATIASVRGSRPRRVAPPRVRAGLKRSYRRNIRLGRVVFEVVIKRRPQNFPAEVEPGVAAELERAECAAITDLLTVMPRTNDQKHFVMIYIFRFDGFINGDCAVNIFLVPKAVHQHDRHFQRLGRQYFVHSLLAPESVIAGVRKQFLPKADLIQTTLAAEFAG